MRAVWAAYMATLLGCGRIGFDPLGDGAAIDLDFIDCANRSFTLTRATQATYETANGTWAMAGVDEARCTRRGVLVEQSATNYVTNSKGIGSSPDNLPLDWGSQHDVEVLAMGTVVPSTYLEQFNEVAILITNTVSSGPYFQVMLDVPIEPPTVVDSTFTLSWFTRSPDPAGLSDCLMMANHWTTGYTTLIATDTFIVVAEPGPVWTRLSRSLNVPAGTGVMQPFINCSPNANATFVLDLAAPQVEAGPRATTPILTTGAASSARLLDRMVIDGRSWMLGDDGSLVLDVELDGDADRTVFAVEDGGGAAVATVRVVGNTWSLTGPGAPIMIAGATAGRHRLAIRFADPSGFAVDGQLVTDGALGLPAGGAVVISGLDGAVARARYWPSALDDTLLATITR